MTKLSSINYADKTNTNKPLLCKRHRLTEAIQLLDHISHPSPLLYSNLLNLCLQHRSIENTKKIHTHIKSSGFSPRVSSFNRIINCYCKCGSLVHACKVFDEMVDRDLCSWNTLVSGYAKDGRVDDARKLFDEMLQRDNFYWTAIISGYVRNDMPKEALEMCRVMMKDSNVKCNKFTVCSVLAASAASECLIIGKEIHGHIVRAGIDSNVVVWSALSDMYGKCGTCPNFSSDSNPQPISSVSPSGMMNLTSPATSSSPQNHRKRSSGSRNRTSVA